MQVILSLTDGKETHPRPPNENLLVHEPLALDSEHAVQRHLDVVQDAVVGFE